MAAPHGPIATAPKQELLALHLFMLGSQDMALILTGTAMVLAASLIEDDSQNSRSPRNNAGVQQSSPYSLDLTESSSS